MTGMTHVRGQGSGNGQQGSSGPGAPVWLRDWQYQLVHEAKTDIWKTMPLWSTACTVPGRKIPGMTILRLLRLKRPARSTSTRRTVP